MRYKALVPGTQVYLVENKPGYLTKKTLATFQGWSSETNHDGLRDRVFTKAICSIENKLDTFMLRDLELHETESFDD